MKPERQREIVRRLLALHEQKSTELAPEPLRNPAADYTSTEQFALEQQRLFRDRPVVACLSVDVAEPGAYVATDCGGIPVAVVRGEDGRLRAFVNICRHRASIVLEGQRHAEPQHRLWVPRLDLWSRRTAHGPAVFVRGVRIDRLGRALFASRGGGRAFRSRIRAGHQRRTHRPRRAAVRCRRRARRVRARRRSTGMTAGCRRGSATTSSSSTRSSRHTTSLHSIGDRSLATTSSRRRHGIRSVRICAITRSRRTFPS